MTAKIMSFLKPLLPGKPKIIFTHGVTNTPEEIYHTADIIHQVNIENYNKMDIYCKEQQLPNKQILIPHFLPALPKITLTNNEIRKKYNLPEGKIMLNVGAIESIQKRTNYVFEEFIQLPDSWILVICGKVQDKALHEKYKAKLKDRYINLYLPNSEMKHIYKVATIFAQASINEGFGMVLLEAMRQGLPCFAHKRPLFEWILKSPNTLVDMNIQNQLSSKIVKLQNELTNIGTSQYQTFMEHFEWNNVKKKYLKLY